MTTYKKALTLALEALEDNQHLIADNERHAYVMEYNSIIEKCKEALAQSEHEFVRGECVKCGASIERQEPVAWATREDFYRELEHRLKHIREEMKIKSVTMRCKDYDIALPIIDTDFGRVLVGQVSTPSQPEQEPVGFAVMQKPWVGLTKEEKSGFVDQYWANDAVSMRDLIGFVEAKIKEKNNG